MTTTTTNPENTNPTQTITTQVTSEGATSSEFDTFDAFARALIQVPKEEIEAEKAKARG